MTLFNLDFSRMAYHFCPLISEHPVDIFRKLQENNEFRPK